MSNNSWVNTLTQAIHQLKQADKLPRVAVMGIGNALRGDDAAGILVAQALRERQPLNVDEQLAADCRPVVLVIDAGAAPESYTGQLRQFHPDLVLLVDAADMGCRAGAVSWLAWQDTAGLTASTHTLPPHLLGRYLAHELGCEVALIGIQPAATTFALLPSFLVKRAIEQVVGELKLSLNLPIVA